MVDFVFLRCFGSWSFVLVRMWTSWRGAGLTSAPPTGPIVGRSPADGELEDFVAEHDRCLPDAKAALSHESRRTRLVDCLSPAVPPGRNDHAMDSLSLHHRTPSPMRWSS